MCVCADYHPVKLSRAFTFHPVAIAPRYDSSVRADLWVICETSQVSGMRHGLLFGGFGEATELLAGRGV